MRPIPPKLKADLAADPWYTRCCITGIPSVKAKIEWHHAFIFAGRQVNEKWAIVPLTAEVHKKVSNPIIKEKLRWIILNRAGHEALIKYSRSMNLVKEVMRLNAKYGVWQP